MLGKRKLCSALHASHASSASPLENIQSFIKEYRATRKTDPIGSLNRFLNSCNSSLEEHDAKRKADMAK